MRICIDLDGVIANFTDSAIMMTEREYGIKFKYEDFKVPNIGYMITKYFQDQNMFMGLYGTKTPSRKEIYSKICPPGFFYNLAPFPGAIQAVKDLYNDGHEIIFLTLPLNWDTCSKEKEDWLNAYFHDIEYSIIMVSSPKIKNRVQCDCLIDDDPYALGKMAPHHCICIERPWNEEFREKTYEGISAASMREAADWLIDNKEFMSMHDKGGVDAPKSN